MRYIINAIIRIIAFLYLYGLRVMIDSMRNKIDTLRISKPFREIGANVNIIKLLEVKKGGDISVGDNFLIGTRNSIEAWGSYVDQKFTPEIVIGNSI